MAAGMAKGGIDQRDEQFKEQRKAQKQQLNEL